VGEAVAAAVEEGLLGRAELFLQTKFTSLGGQDHRLPYDAAADPATQVRQSFATSLEHLRTTYVDALVLHGPSRAHGLDAEDWQVWRAMEELRRAGGARLIGVSNVSLDQLRTLHGQAEVKPAFVQNRCFARTGWDRGVREFCRAHAIAYQGFSLLTANARELHQPAVLAVARRRGRTLPQVVFRFALQVDMIPLTGTSSEAHMGEDLACFDFALDDDEVAAVERCGS
jgi:diketogulonate reductase-like aldo/keto reductase